MKPIDKTKKSNKRCCNCEFWYNHQPQCKDKNYWNICPLFEWAIDKEYLI